MASQAQPGSVTAHPTRAAANPSKTASPRRFWIVAAGTAIALALYAGLLLASPYLTFLLANSDHPLHPEPQPSAQAAAPTTKPEPEENQEQLPSESVDEADDTEPEPTSESYDIANTLVIDKIGVRLAIPEINNAAALEQGTWHRRPHQGNPEIGGNFILTGHRFGFDWTPGGVARNSAFFHLGKLVPGDVVTVYWNQRRYEYEIVESHRVNPDAGWIENQSDTHRLTLYTCTLGGEYDGRVVYTARPLFELSESV